MAFSLPLPVSSSSLLSISGKKQGSKNRREKCKKMPIVAVITTATTTQKKQVRFQLSSDVVAAGTTTTTTTTTGPHLVESKGRQQQGCGKTKGRPSKLRRTATKDHTWYTAKELKSFRTDIELTIKWMITKGLSDDDRGRGSCSGRGDHSSSSSLPPPNRKKKKADDTTAMMSMYLRMLYLEHYQHYPFCAQGVECRTPLEVWCKKKRRKDAIQSVLTLQQQQQQISRRLSLSSDDTTTLQEQQQVDRNVTALANVYALSCQESCSLALDRGRRNDSSTDKDVTRSSSLVPGTKEEEEQEQQQHWQKKKKREERKKTTMLLRSSSITLAYQYHTFCDDMVSLLLLLNKSLIGGKE